MRAVAEQPNPASEPLGRGSQSDDDLDCIKFPHPSFWLRVLHRLRLHRFPLLYGFLLELRSLLWRISRLLRTKLYRRSLDIGQAFEKTQDGSYRESARTRACSMDMRNLYATYPGLTILDAEIFLAGWRLGWEWGHNNADTEKRHKSSVS